MAVTFHHKGKYTGDDFTIDEVINSLSAQKELIEAGVRFLSEIDGNFRYDGTKIRVESIARGTLGWDFLVEVYGQYQKQIQDEVVGSLEGVFNVDIPAEYEGLVTLGAIAVTYMVARYAYDRVARVSGSSAPSVHISGQNNVVIQQIAGTLNAETAHIEKALERSLPPAERKRLIPRVADFLRPSRKEDGQEIKLVGAPDIPSAVLQEFPSDAALATVDDSVNIDVAGAKLNIRGLDRDKHKQGWHAAILGDDRFPKRLPMDLYPTVDPEKLADYPTVTADLVVECEKNGPGDLRPKRIHLLSFTPPETKDGTAT